MHRLRVGAEHAGFAARGPDPALVVKAAALRGVKELAK